MNIPSDKEQSTNNKPHEIAQALSLITETITPNIATELLKTNTRNRPLNAKHVAFLAGQMNSGTWQMAGDPIRISNTGVLLDGQHRLQAIVVSQTAQPMVVIRGLPDQTFYVMDTGRIRQANDILAVSGFGNAKHLASVARAILNYQRGNMENFVTNKSRGSAQAATNSDILDFVKQHDIEPFVMEAKRLYTESRLFSVTEYALFYYILSQIRPDEALRFLKAFASGANLEPGSPVFVLRKKIETFKLNRISTSGPEKLAYVIKSWNLYRHNKPGVVLIYNATKEHFPTPI